MAKGIRIYYKYKTAYSAIRTDPRLVADLRRRAEDMADACGPGYEVLPQETPRKRAHAVVTAKTVEAKLDNARNQTLLRNISAAAR